jgi:alpha-soluble NSF attachment protein
VGEGRKARGGSFPIVATEILKSVVLKFSPLVQSMDSFTKAADYYESENSPSNAQSCRLKVAHFAASLGKFDKAVEIFESCASASADNKLLKFSVREYLIKASFCLLAAGDLVGAKRAATEKYGGMCFEWTNSRESKFIEELIAAIEAYDSDAFTAAVQDFDSTNRLDQWKTNILLKIKETIKEETDLT